MDKISCHSPTGILFSADAKRRNSFAAFRRFLSTCRAPIPGLLKVWKRGLETAQKRGAQKRSTNPAVTVRPGPGTGIFDMGSM